MKRPTALLLLFAATFLVDGLARAIVLPQADVSVALVHGVAIAIICYAWARADSAERGAPTPGRSALYAGFFPVLGVPAYLFRTRGLATGALGSAKAFAFLVVLAVLDSAICYGIVALRH